MRRLSKKDRQKVGIIFVVSLALSYLVQNVMVLNPSDTISFISVISGFLLSAIAILYASPMRSVLYDKKSKYYDSKWEEIIVRYFYTFVANLLYMLGLALNIKIIPQYFNVACLITIVIVIILVTKELFRLLSVEVND